jgi:AcrR family transcriptional regulator
MLEVALDMFAERGFDGTSIAELANATGLSKAAFSYHFAGKDEILVELAEPLIADMEQAVAKHQEGLDVDTIESLLGDYIDALLRHRKAAVWIDGDKSVSSHPEVGARLDQVNLAMRRLIVGGDTDAEALVWAASVLGAIWRPVRNLTDIDVSHHRSQILSAALELAAPK